MIRPKTRSLASILSSSVARFGIHWFPDPVLPFPSLSKRSCVDVAPKGPAARKQRTWILGASWVETPSSVAHKRKTVPQLLHQHISEKGVIHASVCWALCWGRGTPQWARPWTNLHFYSLPVTPRSSDTHDLQLLMSPEGLRAKGTGGHPLVPCHDFQHRRWPRAEK